MMATRQAADPRMTVVPITRNRREAGADPGHNDVAAGIALLGLDRAAGWWMSWAEHVVVHHAASAARDRRRRRKPGIRGPINPRMTTSGQPGNWLARRRTSRRQAVTACLRSLLVTWMLRGLAASWTGMVRVRTPAA